jgi:hypothetical protein
MFNGVQWIFIVLFPHTKKQLPTPGLFQGFPDLSVTGTVAALCLIVRWQQPWVDHWGQLTLGKATGIWGKKCPAENWERNLSIFVHSMSDLCDFAIA